MSATALKLHWRAWAPIAIGVALLLSPVPPGLKADAWHYFAVFVAVISGLVLESMPVSPEPVHRDAGSASSSLSGAARLDRSHAPAGMARGRGRSDFS